jgi:hypothetical protein
VCIQCAGEAYSNGMSLRRITGCVVMALLLASVALPAMCGACMDFAAKPACGEKHDAEASGNKQHSLLGHCADCGDQPGITAKETAQHVSASEFMILDCARRICVEAAEQTVAIYRHRIDKDRKVADGATISGLAAGPALRTIHYNVFGSGKIASGNSAYQPLAVSLKI